MMTAATFSRGSRMFGRITGYVLPPSVSVRLVTSSPQRPRSSAALYDRPRIRCGSIRPCPTCRPPRPTTGAPPRALAIPVGGRSALVCNRGGRRRDRARAARLALRSIVGHRGGVPAVRRRDDSGGHRPHLRRRVRVLRRRGRGGVRLRRRRRAELFFAGGSEPAALYRNESPVGGALRFARQASPVTDLTAVTGAYPLDIDSDGHVDLAVLRRGGNVVLRGLGDCALRGCQRVARRRRW